MGIITQLKDALTGKAPITARRSSKWPGVRNAFLKTHTTCAVCGSKDSLQVHHKKPFHLFPDLELDPSNLIALCESKTAGTNCHLLFGHLGSFQSYNPSVEADSIGWQIKIANRPKVATGKQVVE